MGSSLIGHIRDTPGHYRNLRNQYAIGMGVSTDAGRAG